MNHHTGPVPSVFAFQLDLVPLLRLGGADLSMELICTDSGRGLGGGMGVGWGVEVAREVPWVVSEVG